MQQFMIRSLMVVCLWVGYGFHAMSQTLDTLVDAGGYRLHFNIIRGKGIPVLFEAGGGDDGGVWNKLKMPLANITGTTIITYDRPGFGKSEIDSSLHGLLNGVKGLDHALHRLGYTGSIMLVAHSQGAFTATLYAALYPGKVKAAVLIDASTACWFDEKRVAVLQAANDADKKQFQQTRPGLYYQLGDLTSNTTLVRNNPLPVNIPVIDFVSGEPPFRDSVEKTDWVNCHQAFVSAAKNRTGITAYGCGHYIFLDNPPLVIAAITKMYVGLVDKDRAAQIMMRSLDYAISAANETKIAEIAYRHSEDDLNSWGYALLQQGDMQRALEIFKLNAALHPASWNVYDSYGETLLKNGQKEQAITMYKKSVELNPKNEHGKKVLAQLLNP